MSDPRIQTDLLKAVQAALPDNALRAVRESALAEFEHAGLPAARAEDWKYTNLTPVTDLSNDWLERVVAAGGAAAEATPGETALPDFDAHWLVLRDGIVDDASLAALEALAERGVRVTRLSETPEAVAVDGPYDRLNAILLRDGVRIEAAPDAKLDRPLAILFDDGGSAVCQARIVIDLARGANLDIVEYHRTRPAREHFANTVSQVTLAEGARAGYLRIQDRDLGHYQVGKLGARLARDSTLDYASFDLGGALIRQDVNADIVEPGAAVRMNGLYLAGGRQHIDNHTRIDHRVGPASSREVFHGIVNDRARCVWNGKAIVHVGADGSDAEQSNHNLLLSQKAEVDTKPELEIYADDVKCSHGATVGRLDETAMFYMRSRGLDRAEARHVLTRAFAGRVLSMAPMASIHSFLEARIDARLDTLLEEHAS